MSLEIYLTEHIKKYPYIQPQDIVKLCYQAANGAEHLLKNADAAKAYFNEEYAQVSAQEGELYEKISPDVCRIHLPVWKASGMPEEWLFRMFVESAKNFCSEKDRLKEYLNIADNVVRTAPVAFSVCEWEDYLEKYAQAGMPAVHHSQVYRDSARPSYRIVSARYLCVMPILEAASKLTGRDGVKVAALDGRAAAGKTTRAELLRGVLGADVIHMDDFFLPPVLRSRERLEEPGGNVHYERFMEEVLPHICEPEAFAYRIFNCGLMDYHGERKIRTGEWRIVEGSYSHHPKFGEYADLKVFCDVGSEEQMNRIRQRNGDAMAKMFEQRWIPMEERYFEQFHVLTYADMHLNNKNVLCKTEELL